MRIFRHCQTMTVVCMLAMTLNACSSTLSDPVVPRIPADQVYWRLLINYRAINLAVVSPYNTVQLQVAPQTMQGTSMTEWRPENVTWQVLDTAKLQVDSTGLLRAIGIGNSMRVIATLQIGDVTHSDTALVKVTATAPASPLTRFSIQPTGDAHHIPEHSNLTVRPIAANAAGGNIASLQVSYRMADQNIATVANSGITNASIAGKRRGETMLFSETYAYGVYAEDSAKCQVDLALFRIFSVVLEPGNRIAIYPDSVTLGVGGTVLWRDNDFRWEVQDPAPAVAFEFPDKALRSPTAEGGTVQPVGEQGNIPSRLLTRIPFSYSYLGGREFHEPGTYYFYVGPNRTRGTIVVIGP